jgi:D-alanine-D-alanine ligase
VGNIADLVQALARGRRWDLAFTTAEGIWGFGRESQVPALLEAFSMAYTFADPLACALTLHKAMAKRVLRDAGIPTAPFCVVEDADDASAVDLPWPLFVKPVAEGTAKGIDGRSRVETPRALRERCAEVISRHRQPALVESYLPGREFTVGIVGSGGQAAAIGTLEVVLREGAEPHSYTYRNKERCEEFCEFPLADRESAALVEPIALAAWRCLDGRDAGRVDLRLDAQGRPCVLELNPLPGLHPTHSDLPILCSAVGIGYRELIAAIVHSAAARIPRALRLPPVQRSRPLRPRRVRTRVPAPGAVAEPVPAP